jgi:hypothetical protein
MWSAVIVIFLILAGGAIQYRCASLAKTPYIEPAGIDTSGWDQYLVTKTRCDILKWGFSLTVIEAFVSPYTTRAGLSRRLTEMWNV